MTPSADIGLIIDGQTAILTLNRPSVHHAIDEAMMAVWEDHLGTIETTPEVRTIILTASGSKTFCAGGDIRYFATLDTREKCISMSRRMQHLLDRLYFGKHVVIAAINGQALGGGCEIITACHFRIAASTASFAFRQAPNGIITGWGGGRRLLRQLRRSDALRLLLTGTRLNATEAERIGLVDQLAQPDQLLVDAAELAQQIHQHPEEAVIGFLGLARSIDRGAEAELADFETETFADLWMGPFFRNFVASYTKK